MSIQEETTQFERFDVRPLTPTIGAELLGVDLRKFDTALINDIRAALLTHKVVFFRDQSFTAAEHITFASQFGELEVHPATPKEQSDPELLRIAHGPDSRGFENFWHSDVTWREKPSLGSILHAITIPSVGGDTLFANMELAYERLDAETKEQIETLVAVHDIARVFAQRLGKKAEELHDQYPPMEHPLVRTHPETGNRSIYVNTAFTSHIKGMDANESAALLDRLYKMAWDPEVQCRFRWQEGSVAFWDNRASQHFAASDYFPEVRIMERVTIAGDRPYLDPSE
ncbi:MAG: taurine dioxygenase [Candidatus Azotimanducaceae bacterium]|jgi:taurine dioxygenase